MQSRPCFRLNGGLAARGQDTRGIRAAMHPRGSRGFVHGLLGACAIALAACEGAEPPGSCGSIPQVRIHTGESSIVTACFNDPNGDKLTYAATSSIRRVATASTSGPDITVTAVGPGTATISVTATDPGGLKATVSFRVLVPNRPPVARGFIPAFNTTVGGTDSLDVSPFFHEPDEQPLTYEAASPDHAVVTASLDGSVVTLVATGAGKAVVVITATDPEGLSGIQPVTVTVRPPEDRYRDDFETPASLDSWLLNDATALVAHGRLELTNTTDAGLAERSVAAPLSPWTINVSMGRNQDDSHVGVWWLTGHPVYTIASFEIGSVLTNNYSFYLFDSQSETVYRIPGLSGFSDIINEGTGELTEIELSLSGGRLRAVVGQTELIDSRGSFYFRQVLGQVTSVALVSRGPPGRTALFDWIEVDGTPAGAPALDRVAPETSGFDVIRRLLADGELKVVEKELSELFGPGR